MRQRTRNLGDVSSGYIDDQTIFYEHFIKHMNENWKHEKLSPEIDTKVKPFINQIASE